MSGGVVSAAYRKYLLPGLVFQAVVIGGGYGTGREVVEFFLPHGPLNAFLGLLLAGAIWGLVLALAFEFARLTQSYDYRTFYRHLLGRYWFAFELFYLSLCLIILAVLFSAAGEIFGTFTPFDPHIGMVVLALLTTAFAVTRASALELLMSAWSFVLYIAYGLFALVMLYNFWDGVATERAGTTPQNSLPMDALRYAGYNLAAMPQVLFALKYLERRREAFGAGLLAGLLGISPAILLTMTLLPFYPDIMTEPVPVIAALSHVPNPWLIGFFNVALFGTFVQTSVGIIHSLNERIEHREEGAHRRLSALHRAAITLGVSAMIMAVAINVGIIGLVSEGYGIITYGFIAIVIVPMLTVGVLRIVHQP